MDSRNTNTLTLLEGLSHILCSLRYLGSKLKARAQTIIVCSGIFVTSVRIESCKLWSNSCTSILGSRLFIVLTSDHCPPVIGFGPSYPLVSLVRIERCVCVCVCVCVFVCVRACARALLCRHISAPVLHVVYGQDRCLVKRISIQLYIVVIVCCK